MSFLILVTSVMYLHCVRKKKTNEMLKTTTLTYEHSKRESLKIPSLRTKEENTMKLILSRYKPWVTL